MGGAGRGRKALLIFDTRIRTEHCFLFLTSCIGTTEAGFCRHEIVMD